MKKKIMGLWIACLCAVSMLLTGTVSCAEIIHETDLEKYILEEMSAAHVLGMSISIVSPSKELYCAAYGQAQNTDMDYVLGGTTKTLTAAAILHMAEVKDLTLDDTVADYLPDYPAVADVTIRELLYQTSGIAPEERMSDLQGLGTRGEFADANANYNLLGMIIEKVSDISYEEYISDTILDTLEMESTYSKRNDTGMDGTLLPAYQGYFGFPFAAQYKYDKNEDWMQVPSGQMISDVKDMGKYLQVLLNHGGELLLGNSVEQLLYGDIPVADTNGKMFGGSASAGMGWFAKEVDGQPILYSTGMTENYNTALVLLPEKDLGIAMMFNSTDFLVGQQLINKLQEGIVSVELDREPEQIDKDIYMTRHGVYDVIMVLLVLASWMPILLMGVWCRHRRKKLFTIPGIIMDILIQLVLPTALLLTLPERYPVFLIKRMTPDIYYVGLSIILTLYLGAAIKIIAMVILKLLPQRATEEATVTEEMPAAETASEIAGTVKAATTRAKRDRMLETVRTGILEKDDLVTGKSGQSEGTPETTETVETTEKQEKSSGRKKGTAGKGDGSSESKKGATGKNAGSSELKKGAVGKNAGSSELKKGAERKSDGSSRHQKGSVAKHEESSELNKGAAGKSGKNSGQQKEAAAKHEDSSELNKRTAEKQTESSGLNKGMAEKQDESSGLQEEAAAKSEGNSELQKETAAKPAETSGLQEEAAAEQKEHLTQQEGVTEKQVKSSERQEGIAEKQDESSERQKGIVEKQVENSERQEGIAEKQAESSEPKKGMTEKPKTAPTPNPSAQTDKAAKNKGKQAGKPRKGKKSAHKKKV